MRLLQGDSGTTHQGTELTIALTALAGQPGFRTGTHNSRLGRSPPGGDQEDARTRTPELTSQLCHPGPPTEGLDCQPRHQHYPAREHPGFPSVPHQELSRILKTCSIRSSVLELVRLRLPSSWTRSYCLQVFSLLPSTERMWCHVSPQVHAQPAPHDSNASSPLERSPHLLPG